MKYLNEFIDYLKKEGYEDKYHDFFCGGATRSRLFL